VRTAETCGAEEGGDDTDIGVEEEERFTCCLPGGESAPEDWDEDDCLNNGGDVFGPLHMCEIHLPDEK
jgi:hypothetical protein